MNKFSRRTVLTAVCITTLCVNPSVQVAVAAPPPPIDVFAISTTSMEVTLTGDVEVSQKRNRFIFEHEITASNLSAGEKIEVWVYDSGENRTLFLGTVKVRKGGKLKVTTWYYGSSYPPGRFEYYEADTDTKIAEAPFDGTPTVT